MSETHRIVVPLSRPLKVIDQTLTELSLREMTGEDLSDAGYPTRFTAKGATEFDAPAMTRMIARLAGVPLTAANALPARDWNRCAMAISAFLGDGAAASD